MTIVAGSKQYRSVVVPYQPRRKGVRFLVGGVLLLTVAGMFFWLGGSSIQGQYQRLKVESEQLTIKLKMSELKREEVSQRLATAALGADVDREAVNEVRASVREHQQTIAQLNEEIGFYKGLMAPTEREKGLSIRSWEVYSTSDTRRYQFKMVVQQLAHKHRLLKGSLAVNIVGQLGAEERVLPLSSLSGKNEHQNIKLRFKYFQNFDGEIKLPEGFEPRRVDIVARASSPKRVQIERHYSWTVQQ
ncbi:MAG: hypothetical protein JKY66_09840 [Spongiibacteraceae bacterium]|nr:hypothetical protein [Spongiibacteraceae bacterium]